MQLTSYLALMKEQDASDLFVSVGAPINMKVHGKTGHVGQQPLTGSDVRELAYGLISDEQRKEFEENLELNFAISHAGIGRFRINLYRQRGEIAMVVRYVKSDIPSIEDLNMPEILNQLVMEPRGLILIVGATGSGKSTTLAAMLDHRNRHVSGHILTIEEPIEFLHSHQKSVVDQREVGFDTHSYDNALKNAMREAPDVIMIGEIRDRATMQHAIAYAETGHLCLSTLHANNANQTIDRIINFFPDSAHNQLRKDLALNLRGVISQRLIPALDGGRVAASEVMLKSGYISELIERGDIDSLKEAIDKGRDDGMHTFDQSLYDLYKAGKISKEMALEHADSRTNLGLNLRLEQGAASH